MLQRKPGEGIRDALAGAVALAWVWGAGAIVFAVATGRPVVSKTTLQALIDHLPGPWALVLGGVVAIVLLMAGFRHIMSRQRSRLEVPYGIAISAAGLWVLGEQTIAAASRAAQTG